MTHDSRRRKALLTEQWHAFCLFSQMVETQRAEEDVSPPWQTERSAHTVNRFEKHRRRMSSFRMTPPTDIRGSLVFTSKTRARMSPCPLARGGRLPLGATCVPWHKRISKLKPRLEQPLSAPLPR